MYDLKVVPFSDIEFFRSLPGPPAEFLETGSEPISGSYTAVGEPRPPAYFVTLYSLMLTSS